MAFDPSQFGATLATPTPSAPAAKSFNPADFGATAVSAPPQPAQQPEQGGMLTQEQEVQNFKNTPQTISDLATGAGKGLISIAQSSSDLVNKIASFIPPVLHNQIKAAALTNPILMPFAAALGLVSKISPTISNFENEMGGTPGSLTAPKNTNETVGSILGQAGSTLFAPEEIGGGIADAASNAAEKLGFKSTAEELAQKDLSAIQETISPKPTVKVARLAQSEGRLIKGQEPTLLKSGTPDTVLPSDKTIQASKTIQQHIPGAADMNVPKLYTALDNKTAEIAQQLTPEMKKVQVNPSTIEKTNSAWEELQKTQLNSADATDEANIKKIQGQFSTRLNSLQTKGATLNDWWEARQAYDASVPANVKSANSLSSDILQSRKSIWLQNRGILNNAIHDSESGLGSTSRQAFSDMHDMYNAKEGLQSKAKIETKIQPSKLSQAYNSKTGKIFRNVAKVGIGLEGAKKVLEGL